MRKRDSGQALVEVAIVVPLLMFIFLVLLQIMLLAHSRVLLEYAAFSACRAGVVHNGNPSVMRNAAVMSLLPAFGKTGSPQDWLKTWLKVSAVLGIGTALDAVTKAPLDKLIGALGLTATGAIPSLEIVHVEVVNPTDSDFGQHASVGHAGGVDPNPDEIDFDLPARTDQPDADALRKTRLSVRVTLLYPLRVPIADRLVWYGFMAAAFFRARLVSDHWADWFRPRISTKAIDPANPFGTKSEDAASFIASQPFALDFDPTIWPGGWRALAYDQLMFQELRLLPKAGLYLIPIYAFYSMPMESNFYRSNLSQW